MVAKNGKRQGDLFLRNDAQQEARIALKIARVMARPIFNG